MKKLSPSQKLDIIIEKYQDKHKSEFSDIQESFNNIIQDFRPKSIIQRNISTNSNVSTNTNSNNLLQNTLGVLAGFVANRMLTSKSSSITKKILGYAMQYGITKYLIKK